MKKLILLNGIITAAGLLLDIYGVYDLSIRAAILGLILGIIDCATFILMREGIREAFRRQLAMREVILGDWFEDMEREKPQVVVTVAGRSLFNRVLFLARKMGYVPVDLSENRLLFGTTFTAKFNKAEMEAERVQDKRRD
jgi:hypothetical protein